MTETSARADGGASPAALEVDASLVTEILTGFVREEVRKVGFERGVVGLSGGINSAVTLALVCRGLDPENAIPVIMPYRASSPASERDARLVAAQLGATPLVVDISPQIDAYFASSPDADRNRRGNKMARERMSILYDISLARDALVVGTSNKTELLLGYGTIHGDMAHALNPLGDLYKTQVFALARHLGLPAAVIEKPPSADLWEGQSDEDELGFEYAAVDLLLHHMVDERRSPAELRDLGFADGFVEQIRRRGAGQPVQAPAAAHRQALQPDHRPRVPLPARLGPVTGAATPPGGLLTVLATPIGNLEDVSRRAERALRECEAVVAEDTRRTRILLRSLGIDRPVLSLPAFDEERRVPVLLARLEAGQRLTLCTDAGTPAVSDPGSRLVAAAHQAGVRVTVVPGPSAVTAAVSASGLGGGGFVFLGFPPRSPGRLRRTVAAALELGVPVVLFEAANRLARTLELIEPLAASRTVVVARELTKVHETLHRATARELAEEFRRQPPRGECTVVIGT